MTTTTAGIAATTPDRQAEDRVDAASRTVHAAEGQLHTAVESGVHSWQSAAANTLHTALEEYLTSGSNPAALNAEEPAAGRGHPSPAPHPQRTAPALHRARPVRR